MTNARKKNATAPEKFAGREALQHKRGDVDQRW